MEETIALLQDGIDPQSGYKLDVHHVGAAVKHYMSLKDLQGFNGDCIRCGSHPPILIFDAIRKINCDLKAEEVTYDESGGYNSFSDFYEDCCKSHLLKGMVSKKSVTKADLDMHGIKKYSSLPCFISKSNKVAAPPMSTRPIPRNNASDNFERPEDEPVTPGMIKRILESDRCYKELVKKCRKHGIDISGGIPYMIERILDNTNHFSEVFKNFTKVEGKTGGILRAFCQHGCMYCCKFLILPEGITDYVQMFMGCAVKPTFCISDVAYLFAMNLSKHYPGILGDYFGMLADPEDEQLIRDMMALGKKVNIDINPTTNAANFDVTEHSDSKAHP